MIQAILTMEIHIKKYFGVNTTLDEFERMKDEDSSEGLYRMVVKDNAGISLDEVQNTWLFSEDAFLLQSPSRKQLSVAQELRVRESMHDLIIRAATKLKLDGPTILAATIYVNRFYMRLPITTSKYYVVAAALAISCKLHDCYRPTDRIAAVACGIKNPNKTIDENSDLFWSWRDQVLYREELILKNLNFDLNVDLPYYIRDKLLDESNLKESEDSDSLFHDRKQEILKNAVSLIEMLSSLPILVAYDMYTVFGTMVILILDEARERYLKDEVDAVSLPGNYLSQALETNSYLCYRCYRYVLRLLKDGNTNDERTTSHVKCIKRIKTISKEAFFKIANDH